jgi:hypothetical protein
MRDHQRRPLRVVHDALDELATLGQRQSTQIGNLYCQPVTLEPIDKIAEVCRLMPGAVADNYVSHSRSIATMIYRTGPPGSPLISLGRVWDT